MHDVYKKLARLTLLCSKGRIAEKCRGVAEHVHMPMFILEVPAIPLMLTTSRPARPASLALLCPRTSSDQGLLSPTIKSSYYASHHRRAPQRIIAKSIVAFRRIRSDARSRRHHWVVVSSAEGADASGHYMSTRYERAGTERKLSNTAASPSILKSVSIQSG